MQIVTGACWERSQAERAVRSREETGCASGHPLRYASGTTQNDIH